MKRDLLALGLFATAMGFCVVGCGGTTSGGSSGGTGAGPGAGAGGGSTAHGSPVERPDFEPAFVSAVCDHVQACCQQGGVPFDANGCRTNLQTHPLDGVVGTLPPGVTYDPQAAGDCLAEVQQAVATCLVGSVATASSACNRIVVGTKQAGEPCNSTAECVAPSGGTVSCSGGTQGGGGMPGPGGASGDPPQAVCVVMTPPVHRKAGEDCNQTCEDMSGVEDCSGFAIAGGAGGGSSGGPPKTGTCFKNDGLMCDVTTSACVSLHTAGQPCTFDECNLDSFCNGNACTARLAAGAACMNVSSEECADGLACVDEICAPGKPNGMTCQSSSECMSRQCDGKTCVDPNSLANSQVCGTGAMATPGSGH